MVKIQKNGAFLVVHESVLAEHEQLGWVFIEDVADDVPPADDLSKLTVEKLKEMLDVAGVEYPADAKKADLLALLEAVNA
nr:MAG TPA: Thymopoietin protein [Caudoviricetes sp.]